MSPADIEYRLARSLDHYRVRRTQGEEPHPEEYREELGEAYGEFLEILELEQLLDEVLEPRIEEVLPREFGPYTLLRILGRGGAGTVYEGLHRDLGRHEAVKVLHAGYSEEGTALDRFRQEAKVLARVRHDHIVEIYGAGQVEGRPYYAMTLLEGRPLSEVARQGELPSPEALCRGLADVADALQMLHEQGVVHRDVTPANIFLTADGRMVLSDFGLARNLEDAHLTRTGQALGTPLYMSPEQILARRDEIDERTDVYGLGATLYSVLAGRPVFAQDDIRALYQMILSERPEPLRRVAPGVPGRCSGIAMKALEKKPADRYPTAKAMRDDLRAFAEGGRVVGRPVSALRLFLRGLRRRAVPLAAAVLVVGGLALLWANRSGELVVSSMPAAVVTVDEEEWGEVPQTREIEPGRYRVRIRRPGFVDYESPVVIAAGETARIAVPALVPKDPGDPKTLKELAEALKTTGTELSSEPDRSVRGEPPAVTAVLPAGPVRLRDLYRLYAEFSGGDTSGFDLVFRRTRGGETATLYQRPFPRPDTIRPTLPVPREVLDALQPGDRVTWGLERAETATVPQTFDVVADDPATDAALARIDTEGALLPEALRAGFRARELLARGLPLAAFEEARRATAFEDLGSRSVEVRAQEERLAWTVMAAAMQEMDPDWSNGMHTVVGNRADTGILRALAPGADRE